MDTTKWLVIVPTHGLWEKENMEGNQDKIEKSVQECRKKQKYWWKSYKHTLGAAMQIIIKTYFPFRKYTKMQLALHVPSNSSS